MLSLHWPWLLLILPAPWLYRVLRKPAPSVSVPLWAPMYGELNREHSARGRGDVLIILLLSVIWCATVLAAARPVWIGEPITLPTTGRDLLLAVDISGSMEIEDMDSGGGLVDRLRVVKDVVGEFVARRKGDRLGLILFGSNAYLQTPLTFDRATVNTMLQEALIGFAGKGTAIGDAIGLAVKRLQDRPESSRVLILLTDGANTAGAVTPLQAAELAAAHRIKVYTVGIGADEILRRSLFGVQRINPSADLDEDTLTAIAEKTGGRYFRARNPEDLAAVYRTLDQIEPVEQEAETLRPTQALYYWPLAVAILASFALALKTRLRYTDG